MLSECQVSLKFANQAKMEGDGEAWTTFCTDAVVQHEDGNLHVKSLSISHHELFISDIYLFHFLY